MLKVNSFDIIKNNLKEYWEAFTVQKKCSHCERQVERKMFVTSLLSSHAYPVNYIRKYL